MTPKERSEPTLLNHSRKNRIAKGAGRKVEEVNQLIKHFNQMSKMMKMMQGGKGKQMMQMFQGQQ
jgi:signal recognition particle subunit SRP54